MLAGVEKVRIVPGFMAASPLDLYYMPYTHSLIGALILAALLGVVVALFIRQQRAAVFAVVALAAFSHWLLDLVVHAPDLRIYDDVKVGFGLWRWLWISLPLELILLGGGAWLYARYVPARSPRGNLWLWLAVAAMVPIELYIALGPPPVSPTAIAVTALVAYGALVALAAIVDLTRAKV